MWSTYQHWESRWNLGLTIHWNLYWALLVQNEYLATPQWSGNFSYGSSLILISPSVCFPGVLFLKCTGDWMGTEILSRRPRPEDWAKHLGLSSGSGAHCQVSSPSVCFLICKMRAFYLLQDPMIFVNPFYERDTLWSVHTIHSVIYYWGGGYHFHGWWFYMIITSPQGLGIISPSKFSIILAL